MGFFSNQNAEAKKAIEDINNGDDSGIDRLEKLLGHTLAEGGTTTEELEQAVAKVFKK